MVSQGGPGPRAVDIEAHPVSSDSIECCTPNILQFKSRCEASNEAQSADKTGLQADGGVADARREVTALNHQLSTCQSRLCRKEEETAAMQAQVDAAREAAAQAAARATRLESELQGARAEATRLLAQLEALAGKQRPVEGKEGAERDTGKLENDLTEERDALRAATAELSCVRSECHRKGEELAALEAKLAAEQERARRTGEQGASTKAVEARAADLARRLAREEQTRARLEKEAKREEARRAALGEALARAEERANAALARAAEAEARAAESAKEAKHLRRLLAVGDSKATQLGRPGSASGTSSLRTSLADVKSAVAEATSRIPTPGSSLRSSVDAGLLGGKRAGGKDGGVQHLAPPLLSAEPVMAPTRRTKASELRASGGKVAGGAAAGPALSEVGNVLSRGKLRPPSATGRGE